MRATPCSTATPARRIRSPTTVRGFSACDGRFGGSGVYIQHARSRGAARAVVEFLGAASGPGFIDWRPEWYAVYEGIYFNLMRAGMPTVRAGEKLAQKFRDIAWWAHERGRVAAELDPHRQPLDLNALFPIPKRVLRKGFAEGGQEWMWANWGMRWPIRRVKFAMERRREGRSGVERVAVFRFLSEDWSPWIALVRMRERWPGLRFDMRTGISS